LIKRLSITPNGRETFSVPKMPDQVTNPQTHYVFKPSELVIFWLGNNDVKFVFPKNIEMLFSI